MIPLANLMPIIYSISAAFVVLVYLAYKLYKNVLENMDRLIDQLEDAKEDIAELRGMYEEKIHQKDHEYRSLAEKLEQTTIEDVMYNVERDVHAQSHLAQQEITKNFGIFQAEMERAFALLSGKLQADIAANNKSEVSNG